MLNALISLCLLPVALSIFLVAFAVLLVVAHYTLGGSRKA